MCILNPFGYSHLPSLVVQFNFEITNGITADFFRKTFNIEGLGNLHAADARLE
jgi:hypothetical protein